MKERLEYLMKNLPKELDGAVLLSPVFRRYYLGIRSSAGTLFVTRKQCYFIVDFRYIEMARSQIEGAVVILQENLQKQLLQLIDENQVRKIGMDVRHITIQEQKDYQSMVGNTAEFLWEDSLEEVIEHQRMKKDETEIQSMKAAADILERVYERICPFIRSGIRDDEIQRRLGILASEEGSERGSFGFGVFFEKNQNYKRELPDYIYSGKKIQDGMLVTLRMTVQYQGYWADMCRTVCIGKASLEQKELYRQVYFKKKQICQRIKAGESWENILSDNQEKAGTYPCIVEGNCIGLEAEETPFFDEKYGCYFQTGMAVNLGVKGAIPGKTSVSLFDTILIQKDGLEMLHEAEENLREL